MNADPPVMTPPPKKPTLFAACRKGFAEAKLERIRNWETIRQQGFLIPFLRKCWLWLALGPPVSVAFSWIEGHRTMDQLRIAFCIPFVALLLVALVDYREWRMREREWRRSGLG
jgi:hypothetical protein